MTPIFREEWRTIDPYSHERVARHYDNRADARADAERHPHRIVQKRLVSDWEADQ